MMKLSMSAMHWIYFVKLPKAIGQLTSNGAFAVLTIHMAFKLKPNIYRKRLVYYPSQMQLHRIVAHTRAHLPTMRAQRATQQTLQWMVNTESRCTRLNVRNMHRFQKNVFWTKLFHSVTLAISFSSSKYSHQNKNCCIEPCEWRPNVNVQLLSVD